MLRKKWEKTEKKNAFGKRKADGECWEESEKKKIWREKGDFWKEDQKAQKTQKLERKKKRVC